MWKILYKKNHVQNCKVPLNMDVKDNILAVFA